MARKSTFNFSPYTLRLSPQEIRVYKLSSKLLARIGHSIFSKFLGPGFPQVQMKKFQTYYSMKNLISTKIQKNKKPVQVTTPSDSQYLRTLWKIYQHAKVRFPRGYFYLNTGILKEFGLSNDYKGIAKFFQLHKQLQEIYRLAEIIQFKLVQRKNSVVIKGIFSIAEELDQSNYSVYPALVRQKQYSKNKIKHYKKSRDEIVDTYISRGWIGWGKVA
ncbi:MAG: hypothetical protein DRP15_02720, partial [Candidatus Aenigmatarchaeota archaeon]